MLLDTPLGEEQWELANTIRVSGSILLSTVRGLRGWLGLLAGWLGLAGWGWLEWSVVRGWLEQRLDERRMGLCPPPNPTHQTLPHSPTPPHQQRHQQHQHTNTQRSPTFSTSSSWRRASAWTPCAPRCCCATWPATSTASSRPCAAAGARGPAPAPSCCCSRTCRARPRRRCSVTRTACAACCSTSPPTRPSSRARGTSACA